MAGTPSSWRLTHHFGCKDSDDAEGALSPPTFVDHTRFEHPASCSGNGCCYRVGIRRHWRLHCCGYGIRMRSLARVHTEFLQRSSAHVGDRRGRVYIFERTSGSCKKQEDEGARPLSASAALQRRSA